eukprot:tig00020629_g12369.t1
MREARHLRGRPAALLQPARDVIIVLHGDDVAGSGSLARDGKAEGAHAAANHVDSGATWKQSAAREVLAAALGSVGDRGRGAPCRVGVVRCRRGGAELLCPLAASREGVEEALRRHEEPVASASYSGAGDSGSGSGLSAALEACGEHFASQSGTEAQRHVWILTSADWGAAAGGEDAAAAAAERLRREVRPAPSFVSLRAEAAGPEWRDGHGGGAAGGGGGGGGRAAGGGDGGRVFAAGELRRAAEGRSGGAAGATPERLAAVRARLLLGGRGRLRLGEDLQLELTATVRAALPAQAKGSAGALHAALDALPEHIEFSLRDERDAPIPTLEDAFVLEFQDFAGDIFDAAPAAAAAGGAHILLCGPHGSGKSSFFNSLVSCLSERVVAPAVAGGHTEHVTNEFFRFRLDRHEGLAGLPVAIFDSWGIDGANYRGEEMALMLHGALPLQWPMEECVTVEGLRAALEARGQRLQADPSRKIHAVVFIVSYSELDLRSETLDRFAALFRAATLALKRKAVVAISQVDRLGGDAEVLAKYRQKLCALLAISEASVFTLENYCDTKDKSFGIDRAVYRIALAAVRAANDFLCMEANTAVPCPFPLALAPPVAAPAMAAAPRPAAPRAPAAAASSKPPVPARAAAPVPAIAPSPAFATFAAPGHPTAKSAPPSKSAAQGNGKPPPAAPATPPVPPRAIASFASPGSSAPTTKSAAQANAEPASVSLTGNSKAASPPVQGSSFWSEEQIASTLVKVLESAGGSLNGGVIGRAFAMAAGKSFKDASGQRSAAKFCQRRPDLFRVAGAGAPGPQTVCLADQTGRPAPSSYWLPEKLASTLVSLLQGCGGSALASALGGEFAFEAGKKFEELSIQPSIEIFCIERPHLFSVAGAGSGNGRCTVSLKDFAVAVPAAASALSAPGLRLQLQGCNFQDKAATSKTNSSAAPKAFSSPARASAPDPEDYSLICQRSIVFNQPCLDKDCTKVHDKRLLKGIACKKFWTDGSCGKSGSECWFNHETKSPHLLALALIRQRLEAACLAPNSKGPAAPRPPAIATAAVPASSTPTAVAKASSPSTPVPGVPWSEDRLTSTLVKLLEDAGGSLTGAGIGAGFRKMAGKSFKEASGLPSMGWFCQRRPDIFRVTGGVGERVQQSFHLAAHGSYTAGQSGQSIPTVMPVALVVEILVDVLRSSTRTGLPKRMNAADLAQVFNVRVGKSFSAALGENISPVAFCQRYPHLFAISSYSDNSGQKFVDVSLRADAPVSSRDASGVPPVIEGIIQLEPPPLSSFPTIASNSDIDAGASTSFPPGYYPVPPPPAITAARNQPSDPVPKPAPVSRPSPSAPPSGSQPTGFVPASGSSQHMPDAEIVAALRECLGESGGFAQQSVLASKFHKKTGRTFKEAAWKQNFLSFIRRYPGDFRLVPSGKSADSRNTSADIIALASDPLSEAAAVSAAAAAAAAAVSAAAPSRLALSRSQAAAPTAAPAAPAGGDVNVACVGPAAAVPVSSPQPAEASLPLRFLRRAPLLPTPQPPQPSPAAPAQPAPAPSASASRGPSGSAALRMPEGAIVATVDSKAAAAAMASVHAPSSLASTPGPASQAMISPLPVTTAVAAPAAAAPAPTPAALPLPPPPQTMADLEDSSLICHGAILSGQPCLDKSCAKIHDKRLLKGIACKKFWTSGSCGKSGSKCWFNHETNSPHALARIRLRLEAECSRSGLPAASAVATELAAERSAQSVAAAADAPAHAAATATVAAPATVSIGNDAPAEAAAVASAVAAGASAAIATSTAAAAATVAPPTTVSTVNIASNAAATASKADATAPSTAAAQKLALAPAVDLKTPAATAAAAAAAEASAAAPPSQAAVASKASTTHSEASVTKTYTATEQAPGPAYALSRPAAGQSHGDGYLNKIFTELLGEAGGFLSTAQLGLRFREKVGEIAAELLLPLSSECGMDRLSAHLRRFPDLFDISGQETAFRVSLRSGVDGTGLRPPATAPVPAIPSKPVCIPPPQDCAHINSQIAKATQLPQPELAEQIAETLVDILRARGPQECDVATLAQAFDKQTGKSFAAALGKNANASLTSFCMCYPHLFSLRCNCKSGKKLKPMVYVTLRSDAAAGVSNSLLPSPQPAAASLPLRPPPFVPAAGAGGTALLPTPLQPSPGSAAATQPAFLGPPLSWTTTSLAIGFNVSSHEPPLSFVGLDARAPTNAPAAAPFFFSQPTCTAPSTHMAGATLDFPPGYHRLQPQTQPQPAPAPSAASPRPGPSGSAALRMPEGAIVAALQECLREAGGSAPPAALASALRAKVGRTFVEAAGDPNFLALVRRGPAL